MKRISIVILFGLMAMSVLAVPARKNGYVRTAADDTQKTVFSHGDEYFHYLTDAEGNWLDEMTLLPLSAEVKNERAKRLSDNRARRVKETIGIERLLGQKGAIILVSFKDVKFQSTKEEMTDWAMGENYTANGGTGSIRKYFQDQSWGQYNLEFDIYGPVEVEHEYAYYGKDSGGEGNDQHLDTLAVEACHMAVELGADFSGYDSNGDNKVDWVVIIYAGLGQNDGGDANTIWPQQKDLSDAGKAFTMNGKTIDHYCALNEIDGITLTRCGIGIFCHEFSHIMGLPDLYTTNGSLHKTMGMWDVMDYGVYNNDVNTPPAYSAYERWFMGWMTPTLLNSAASVTLGDLNNGNACYLSGDDEPVTDILRPYTLKYMLENRQQKGWDTYLPGHGLMVTKIEYKYNYWNGNTVNNTSSKMGVDLVEADGLTPSRDNNNRQNGYFGKPGDLYPEGAVSCTLLDYPVTNITETDGVISFDFKNGGQPIPLSLETIESKSVTSKIIHDGRILIERNGVLYDLNGRKQ